MDFERAAERLKKDHSKIQRRRPVATSAQAKLQAERAKQQRQQYAAEREKKRRQEDYITEYYRQCERVLGVQQLSNMAPLTLKAVSIHGEGDKIALPPSILEYMTAFETISQSPWIFRIGVLNPDYHFPASPTLQQLMPPEENDSDEMSDDDGTEDSDNESSHSIYLEELSQKYLAYTHGTVVEFTQEEGCVGLPEPIAAALLKNPTIRKTRTVDPSTISTTKNKGEDNVDEEMSLGETDDDSPKTAGHLAWGAFDVPDLPVEITWIQKLPRGNACELTPTLEAVRSGFYSLQDIKLVLEQSLIRTRATLSVGDTVHTWHRGMKYDLQVSSVTPSKYNTVICINTDLEVEFGKAPDDDTKEKGQENTPSENVKPLGQALGYKLSSPASMSSASATNVKVEAIALLDEPPLTQTDHVCTVQIRAPNGEKAQRRFDVRQATLNDLMALAETLELGDEQFQLVTRFPRRVYQRIDGRKSLETAGILAGQEVFLVEKLS
ncbi:hypothetical protein FisN_1Lh616 [Fistulifera solaris]|uniref:UBX domain-containing protein n=1 Tax=Fistulifera solaris TaxID=1519565 RepID=A0A1Z5K0V5_FISSO|nr:hypothetical protein FisN_1Lh616 [Fistulifera solaris]|eukprot:GAX19915.1 hypothetical protein FisN_1Lh616 [Fistulifera solaris]